MPFEIIRHDITKLRVDAIVNAASRHPQVGPGVDLAIHRAAGPRLLEARQAVGYMEPGSAAITAAFDLQARFVIHAATPVWQDGQHREPELLRQAYDRCLALAEAHGCGSVAFPLLAAGNHGFPKDLALQIAISAFSAFLLEHEMQIYLVVFDSKAFKLSEQLFRGVASYIDEHYVDTCRREMYGAADKLRPDRRREAAVCEAAVLRESMPCAPMAAPKTASKPKATSLEDMLKQADAGFTETLLKLIDQSGKKDSEIYKKALLTKQHFSKIRNNPNYKPTKPTAIALALALELDLDATKDLIGRAGYALSNSSKFDLIIRYFIEQGNFNVVEINMALYEFDQPLLGA